MNKRFTSYKVFVVGIMICFCIISPAFSQEGGSSFLRGLHVSSGFVMGTEKNGGYGDIGFPIFQNDQWDIRNNVGIHGYGGEGYGYAFLSEKISVGGWFKKTEIAFRPYGSITVNGGVFGGNGKSLFSLPLSLEILGSGGFEIMYYASQSFFIEYGGGCIFTMPFTFGSGGSFIAMGMRYYFK